MSNWSEKAIKGATVKWSIVHELTYFDSLPYKKELVGLRKLAKREKAVRKAGLLPSLTALSNHKSYVFSMFLPSSPHRKPQSAFSDSTSKASLPVCWNQMTEWQIDMDMYFDTGCLACEYLMLCTSIKRLSPNIIGTNPDVNAVSNNPSSSASQLFWWTDSGGIRWWTFPVTFPLTWVGLGTWVLVEAVQNLLSLGKCQWLLAKVNSCLWAGCWVAWGTWRLPIQHWGSVLDLLPLSKFLSHYLYFFLSSLSYMWWITNSRQHEANMYYINKSAEKRPKATTKLVPDWIICEVEHFFTLVFSLPHYWCKS